ncbi:uncharacterized protein BXZ73DRAFT_40857 [Epithele typhae]|uniref:uncharacterized protein n=1 Tax=Epithele typhae TaxID=378194 RepID=UPI002007739E|nr:uncharacterized protein BXZ73DRAFT_40857 [Epithele typhae]KAH9942521.1 hypothetical protein BXZ73DRAFT_40857 [Epithele typhae]
MSANSSKVGLDHCPRLLQDDLALSPECEGYSDYTYVPWGWLVDLSSIRTHQHLLEGWNFTDSWLHGVLGIPPEDTFYLKDANRNHYSFQDFLSRDPTPLRKYNESIHIAALARRPERLLVLGTLFGSSRLHLRAPAHYLLRKRIRAHMALANAPLALVAARIRGALDPAGRGAYLAVHLRVGDGAFAWHAHENARAAWWRLLRGPLGDAFPDDDAVAALELALFPNEASGAPPALSPDVPALRAPVPPRPPFPWPAPVRGQRMWGSGVPEDGPKCRGPLHTAPHLRALNAPLYVATDAREPTLAAPLWRFVRTFPCAFFLEDFAGDTRYTGALRGLRNPADGVALGPFLMPLLDAMVAGQAWAVVGTEGSTFSAYVTDVLWRTHHGYEIVQRG